jgi:hypothetical protein
MVATWRDAGLQLEATTRSGVEDFERRNRLELPSEFAAFYEAQNGMPDGVYDAHDIRFWPLTEVRAAAEELHQAGNALDGYYVFADYSLWAHAYAIRLSGLPDDVVIVGGDAPIQVAPSFASFLEKYVYDPPSLFPGARK